MKSVIALGAMLILILDSRTAIAGAQEGIALCLQTVIPALFPLFLITQYLCGNLSGNNWKILRPLETLCKVPSGAGGLLVTGFLGGYPVGAGSVYQACKSGQLSRTQGQRMLGFINNAGPAFLFGMGSALFANPLIPWVVWLSHILCAIFTAMLLPGESQICHISGSANKITLLQCLKNTLRVLAQVCGWVILFRIFLSFLFSFLGGSLSPYAKALISGFLELTNGCLLLQDIPEEWLRYLFFTVFINMGGLCVAMQTLSVVGELGIGMYWRGKLMQSLIGTGISLLLLPVLFSLPRSFPYEIHFLIAAGLCLAVIFYGKYLKSSWQFKKIGV